MLHTVGLVFVLIFVSGVQAMSTTCRPTNYSSGGQPVQAYLCLPDKAGPKPGVVILHGADGPTRNEGAYRTTARQLAEQGYAALFVNYFSQNPSKDANGFFGNSPEALVTFSIWVREVKDAITFLGSQNDVQRERIGLLGFSLGGYLSLGFSTLNNTAGAIVTYYGGLVPQLEGGASNLPPTLILHGAKDQVVPVSEAYRLQRLLETNQIPHEVKIYPGQGHGFNGSDSRDAWQRTLAFFGKTLKVGPLSSKTTPQ